MSMSASKARLKILNKIAQTTVPTNLPTDAVANTQPVTGSPPPFNASDFYPSLRIGFQAKNVPWINGLANLLNSAMFYSSGGKVHLPWMRSVNFNFGSDQVPSVDLKNIMNFSKLVYNQLFTNLGQAYQQPLTPQQVAEKIQILHSSQAFNNLSTTSPTSQVATKIGGNVKTLINDYLLQIK